MYLRNKLLPSVITGWLAGNLVLTLCSCNRFAHLPEGHCRSHWTNDCVVSSFQSTLSNRRQSHIINGRVRSEIANGALSNISTEATLITLMHSFMQRPRRDVCLKMSGSCACLVSWSVSSLCASPPNGDSRPCGKRLRSYTVNIWQQCWSFPSFYWFICKVSYPNLQWMKPPNFFLSSVTLKCQSVFS